MGSLYGRIWSQHILHRVHLGKDKKFRSLLRAHHALLSNIPLVSSGPTLSSIHIPSKHYIRSFCTNDPRKSDSDQKSNQIYNIPNTITLLRIASSPAICWFIANEYKMIALSGCIVAAISDWLDGYIAKNYDMKTTLGGLLDPLADKVFIGSVAVGLCNQGLIPMPLTALIITRDVLILSGGLYIRYQRKKSEETFFDLSSKSTFVVEPTRISKLNTFMQFTLIISTLSNYLFLYPTLDMISPMWYITGTTTLVSGLGYLDGQGIKSNIKYFTSKRKDSETTRKDS